MASFPLHPIFNRKIKGVGFFSFPEIFGGISLWVPASDRKKRKTPPRAENLSNGDYRKKKEKVPGLIMAHRRKKKVEKK